MYMTPPPPSPALFPYTTLFRSLDAGGEFRLDNLDRRSFTVAQVESGRRDPIFAGSSAGAAAKNLIVHEGAVTDRKSTRLNSSHGYISYAVFCLKKKKMG